MGLLRSIWQLTTIVLAGPAALVGLMTILDGDHAAGALIIGLAVAFAVLSELAFVRLSGGSVGGLGSLVPGRDRS